MKYKIILILIFFTLIYRSTFAQSINAIANLDHLLSREGYFMDESKVKTNKKTKRKKKN